MAMTWFELSRLLGLDLLVLVLLGLVAGDCVEYVVHHVAPRDGRRGH